MPREKAATDIAADALAASKLSDPSTLEVLCEAAREGMSITDCCAIAGIATRTYRDWKARAAEGLQPYADAWDAIQAARVEGKRQRLKRITKAGKGGAWQADAWYLERVYPSEFGRRTDVTHGGEVKLNHAEARQQAAAIAATLADEDLNLPDE